MGGAPTVNINSGNPRYPFPQFMSYGPGRDNLANVNSTRTPEGGPYRRRQVVFETLLAEAEQSGGFGGRGVEVTEISLDNSDFVRVYRPGHPDADADGYVQLPNINTAEEMADLLSASRAHEANGAAFRVTREMFRRATASPAQSNTSGQSQTQLPTCQDAPGG